MSRVLKELTARVEHDEHAVPATFVEVNGASPAKVGALDDCLHAMEDDGRERILVLLSDRELRVNEITQHIAVTQPTISHHLAVLRGARLISARRDRQQVFYCANPACVVECRREIRTRFGLAVAKVKP